MLYYPCISGSGCYLAPGDGHDRCLSCLGIKEAFVDESCSHCGKITIEELWTRLSFLQRGRVPVPLPWSRAPPGGSWGSATSGNSWAGLTVMVRNSLFGKVGLSQRSCSKWNGYVFPVLSSLTDLSGDDDSAPLPHSRQPVMPDSDTEMVAMLAWAAEKVTRGNIYRVPNPRGWTIDFSRWLVLVLRAPPQYLSFRKCMMRSLGRGRHLSLPETATVACPSSPPSTVGIWRSRRWNGRLRCNCVQIPQPPGVGIRRSPALTSSAYAAWGEAASPLHAMALLQVRQAKALRDLHEGGHDPEVLKELRTATDLALRAIKVTARSLGLAMSTMVQRRQRLSLLVAEGGPLPPPPCSKRSSLQLSSAVEPVAGRPPRPSRSPPNLTATRRARGPETGDPEMEVYVFEEMVNTPLSHPEEGRAENLWFLFPATGFMVSGTQNLDNIFF